MPATPYWQAVRAMRESLPEVVHVTSTTEGFTGAMAGIVSEASAVAVAEHLVAGTVRLSTPEEIERYHVEQDRLRILAGVRADGAAGRFRFSELEAGVRSAAAAVGPKPKAAATR